MSDLDNLRYLCTRHGVIEIGYDEHFAPWCWTVSLVSNHDGFTCTDFEKGERLEPTITALLNRLDTEGRTLAAWQGQL